MAKHCEFDLEASEKPEPLANPATTDYWQNGCRPGIDDKGKPLTSEIIGPDGRANRKIAARANSRDVARQAPATLRHRIGAARRFHGSSPATLAAIRNQPFQQTRGQSIPRHPAAAPTRADSLQSSGRIAGLRRPGRRHPARQIQGYKSTR
ncbi:hypothetical protein [Burkholderia gladioli]|uniref:hypothetical protein n=1 Tax=Burkholderia gladioli TaxID=28095 RepID=UPI001640D579|nr:hypothetical protein [Burkholderia gladioli]